MQLPNNLIAQFAKLAVSSEPRESEIKTLYGTVSNGGTHVLIDGSTTPTPISYSEGNLSSIVDLHDNDRVSLQIANHRVVITGNITNKSVTPNSKIEYTTEEGETKTSTIANIDIVIAEKVQAEVVRANEVVAEDIKAVNADIVNLRAKDAEITGGLAATNADVTNLKAKHVEIDGDLEAVNAEIQNLKATDADFRTLESDYADFRETTTDTLEAGVADIEKLKTDKLDVTWANIDYSNIDKAILEEFYSTTGLIENVTIGDGTITGHLVGVTIRGDLIEANTLVADKLVIQGEDGLYYKLNFESGNFTDGEEVPTDGLHGSVIVAKSITAEKVAVSDLVAFDATIGGFTITDGSLFSGVKASVDNSTRGTYLDAEGQFALGDAFNYIKFYKLTDPTTGEPILDDSGEPIYKLEISADSILFGDGVKSSAADIKALTEHVKIGTIIDDETGDEKPCVELSEGDTDFKQVITNTKTMFMDGSGVGTKIDAEGVHTDNLSIDKELRHNNAEQTGSYVWAFRSNGNYGLSWKSEVNS